MRSSLSVNPYHYSLEASPKTAPDPPRPQLLPRHKLREVEGRDGVDAVPGITGGRGPLPRLVLGGVDYLLFRRSVMKKDLLGCVSSHQNVASSHKS